MGTYNSPGARRGPDEGRIHRDQRRRDVCATRDHRPVRRACQAAQGLPYYTGRRLVMPDLDSLHREYDSVQDVALRFCSGIKQQLEELLSANELTLGVPLESRIKGWSSIAEKAERRSLNLQSVKEMI